MKKILIFVAVLLIVSASVFASGSFEYKYSVEDFQGTWQQVNGSSVITITGNDFTVLNMEIGYAGYGIVSMGWWNKDRIKTEAIRFDMHWNGIEGRSTKGNFFYLGMTEKDLNQFKRDRNYFVNDFQMKAWEEFSPISEKKSRYPDDIRDKYFDTPAFKEVNYPILMGGGGNPYFFELNGDSLNISRSWDERQNNSSLFWYLYNLLFCGEFVRVK